MYQAAVPSLLQMLNALSAVLDKGVAHARSSGTDPATLLQARLAPDMFPLVRQVQIATDHAKGAAARLAGREVPKFEDTEASFEDVKARIAKTVAFIEGVPEGEMDGSEDRTIALTIAGNSMNLTGR